MKKFSRKQKEIIAIIIITVFFITSLLLDACLLHPFSWIISKNEDMFKELFAVQATISTLTIAIVSILSGTLSDSYYGVPLSQFISNIKPWFFKHRRVVVIGLASTLINYFFTAIKLYNLSIFCFFASVCAAIYLAYEIYIVYSGKEKIKKEIYDYYYANYNQLGINYLRKSLLDYNTDKMNDSLSLSDNIELFENIYIQKLNRQENNYDEMDTLLSDVFSKFNKQGEKSKLTKLNNTVVSIYVKANSFDTPFALKLWDEISYPVYESWRIVDLSQWDMRQAITSLNIELYINQIITKEIVKNYKDNPTEEFVAYNCKNIPNYASELYKAMKRKEYGASTKNRLLGDSILLLSRLLSSNSNKKTNETFVYKNSQILLELLNLYRLLAYFKETEIIKEYIFERNYYRSDNIIISRFILLIYLYYLSKEPLISDDLKDWVKKIIDVNKSAVYRCISQLNSAIIKEFYPFLLDLMSTWEEMPRKGGKTIIIDKIITDAVIFSFTVINRYEKEAELSSVIKTIFNKRIDSAYSLYCRDDDSMTEEWIKQFNEFFCLPINYCSESANFLRKVISNLRLKQEIETLNHSLWDSRKKYQELVSNLINYFMDDNKFLFSNENNENEEYTYQKSTACLLLQKRIIASSLNAEDRIELLEPLIKDNIIQNIVEKCISNKLIKVEKISRKDKHKQKRLIELAKEQGLSVDTFIGREYIPHESNPSLIKKQYNNIHSFEPNYRDNRLFLIDSKKLSATISDIQFSMYPSNAKNLEYEKKEKPDGTILYQTIDGAYLPFSKTQYRRYLKHNIKIIYLTAIIRIKASSGICGVGIEIEE